MLTVNQGDNSCIVYICTEYFVVVHHHPLFFRTNIDSMAESLVLVQTKPKTQPVTGSTVLHHRLSTPKYQPCIFPSLSSRWSVDMSTKGGT